MTVLIIALIVAASAAIAAAYRLTHETGTHTAPRGRAEPVPEMRVIGRLATVSQPPADLFPPLAPLPAPAGPLPAAEPPAPDPACWLWTGSADTGAWQRTDLDQLLAGIAA